MRIKKGANMSRKLLFGMLAVLLAAAALPATAGAAPMPSSGTLTIHKYALEDMDAVGDPGDGNPAANIPSDAVPLGGVEFSVWQVDPSAVSGVTTAQQAWSHILTATLQTGITNANGEVTFSLEQGVYYVAETGSTGNQNIVFSEPFLVSVPMTDSVAGNWITDVHAYPKDQSLTIDKFVSDAGDTDYDFTSSDIAKNRPVAVDEVFGWDILSSLPMNMGTANSESYVVTDELAGHFDYIAGSIKVYSVPTMTTPVASAYRLSENSDYTLSFNTATNTLTVKLTDSGMMLLGSRCASNNDRFLMIKYDCKLNGTAANGVSLYSGAEVEYARNTSNSVATAIVVTEPEVHTGKIGITKLADSTNKLLSDAGFGLARTKADAQNGKFIATGITDKNGKLIFSGLKYGLPGDDPNENSDHTAFWLAETKAPHGYKLMKEPVEITFNYSLDENGEYYFAQVNVYNVLSSASGETSTSPKTGDTSNWFLYVGLMALAGSITVFALLKRKKPAAGNGSEQ